MDNRMMTICNELGVQTISCLYQSDQMALARSNFHLMPFFSNFHTMQFFSVLSSTLLV